MQGCTIINPRRHVGLQKLAALAQIAGSCLGPHETYKFVQDDSSGESALVTSCVRVLDNLELTCAVGQLVYETVRTHHRVYHTGSGSLLFLAGAWSRAALECLQRGVLVSHIVSGMSEALEVCSNLCRRNSVSLDSLDYSCSEHHHTGRHLNLKLSRHFCGTRSANVPPDVARVAEGLSHGCPDGMKLVLDASLAQQEQEEDKVFDVSKVLTCVLPGSPEDQSRVTPGCVVPLHPGQIALAHRLRGRRLKVALFDGDLSHSYRHLGFHRLKGVEHVSDKSGMFNEEEQWLEKLVKVLLPLKVSVVLVSGLVGDAVVQHLSRHHILAVGKVHVLEEFHSATGAVAVSYIRQLSQRCVGDGVQLDLWRDVRCDERTLVNIYTCRRSALVSVVVTSLLPGKLHSLEDRFWACGYRLHHALMDAAVLPGAGIPEMLCVHELHQLANKHSKANMGNDHHRRAVFGLMADSLLDYNATVMQNAGVSKVLARTTLNQKLQDYQRRMDVSLLAVDLHDKTPPTKVYDNLSVKLEVWRRALDLVLLVLQTDTEIITSVGQSACQDLMLL
ncbi:chaperonin-containing T-complex member BBS12 [Neosynchiropus ocellatus]